MGRRERRRSAGQTGGSRSANRPLYFGRGRGEKSSGQRPALGGDGVRWGGKTREGGAKSRAEAERKPEPRKKKVSAAEGRRARKRRESWLSWGGEARKKKQARVTRNFERPRGGR